MNKVVVSISYIVSVSMLLSSIYAISSVLDLKTETTVSLIGAGGTILAIIVPLVTLTKTLNFNKRVEYYKLLNQQLNSLIKLNNFINTFGDIHFNKKDFEIPYVENLIKFKELFDKDTFQNELAFAGEEIFISYFDLKEHVEEKHYYYVINEHTIDVSEKMSLSYEITLLHNSFVNLLVKTQAEVRREIMLNHPKHL